MTPFSTPRTNRYTALVVLMVWLFALGSGVANACLLEPAREHSSSQHASNADTPDAPAATAGHEHASGDHGDHHGPAKESCLKACDDGSQLLLKASVGVDQTDPGLAPFVTTLWTAEVPAVLALCRADVLQAPPLGPPVRIRYSRLAL